MVFKEKLKWIVAIIINKRIVTNTVVIILFSCCLLFFLFSEISSAEDIKSYINFIYRAGFFFITTIVSLSVFGNTFKTKLASAATFEKSHFYYMLVAIPCSIIMIMITFFLSLSNHFLSDKWYIFISKILFMVICIIFILILKEFLESFHVKSTLDTNLKKIEKYGLSEETKHTGPKFKTLELKEEDVSKLKVHVEKYVQNLNFLLKTKNEEILNHYMNEWSAILSLVCTMIFHAKTNISDQAKKELYIFMLKQNSVLLIESASNIEFKEGHNKLIKSLFKTLPDLREKTDGLEHLLNAYRYEKNYNLLVKEHFKELYEVMIKLHSSHNSDVFKQMASAELDFLNQYSLQNYGAIREAFRKVIYKDFDKREYIEEFLISTIFYLIENDETKELPTIFSMIFEVSGISSKTIEYKKVGSKGLLRDSKKDKSLKTEEISNDLHKDVISKEIVRGIIYAIIKANEIENYKAAGYLVKAMTQNKVPAETITEVLKEIDEEIRSNKKFILHDSIVNLNRFSLSYCFKKTFLLFYLQYKMNRQEFLDYKLFLKKKEKKYLLKKLNERTKEYNLIALKTIDK
ncbi:hypothetical protein ACQKNB_12950 [Lysinibacillus xylanilyticus]|uniref:hypothetical protein n=1 Tax=Lysinibacillus xylanilyticus TaxID=582475 RepID=UPI003D03501E